MRITAVLTICAVVTVASVAGSHAAGTGGEAVKMDIISRQGNTTASGTIYVRGNQYRIERDGEAAYTIMRGDKRVCWTVEPRDGTFKTTPYHPALKPRTDEKAREEIGRRYLGSEVVNGFATKKFEITAKTGNKTGKFYQWSAVRYARPVKMSAIDGSWVIEYRNIENVAGDGLFDIPAGFIEKPPSRTFMKVYTSLWLSTGVLIIYLGIRMGVFRRRRPRAGQGFGP